VIDYRGFVFILGIMGVGILLMLGLKVLSLALIALMAYHLNKEFIEDVEEDDEIYGCPPDYKSFNRNKDFLDER